jgi:hypothetical protein
MTKIGVVSLATGTKYLDYWKKMILTFKANESKFQSIQFYLLTDSVAEVEEFCRVNQINSKIFLIPSYGWPEATLLRYQEILAIKEFMIEEVCIYLDADMLIQTDIVPKLTSSEWKNGMAFIAHPGFWRPRGLARAIFYLRYPNRILRDLVSKMKFGNLGSWERNALSAAYVPRQNRKIYVCGGVWMGRNQNFFELIEKCSQSVETDLNKKFIAIWHDESHLNKWFSDHGGTVLTPAFCYDPTYPNLASLPEYIRAVRK